MPSKKFNSFASKAELVEAHADTPYVIHYLQLERIIGRELVKKMIRHCMLYHQYEGKPYNASDLLIDRVSTDPPFNNTGVDFEGPLYLKDSQSSATTCKVYVCLFTCTYLL